MKLGAWQEALQGITEESITPVLECYSSATKHDPTWYKAWHAWAYMNFETVLFYKHQGENTIPSRPAQATSKPSDKNGVNYITEYTVPAVEGFFKYVSLILYFPNEAFMWFYC